MSHLEELIAAWDGEAVVCRYDLPTQTWMFLALHSSLLGPPTGGTRFATYPTPADGLEDAMRLAAGMTAKWAILDQPMGGGKGVLASTAPVGEGERRGLLQRYGRLIESLHGGFRTGEDLGTTPEDMSVIAGTTEFVHGAQQNGAVTDPGPFTARGVFRGIEATVREVLNKQDLQGVRILVQGVGDVGAPLCGDLAAAGADLWVADPDERRVAMARKDWGAQAVDPEEVYDTACDVFAPCALGAVLNEETIPRLRTQIVAGSANNQLREDADATRLHERGIVYAPDYVINGGGALAFSHIGAGEGDTEVLMELMDTVGTRIEALVAEGKRRDESPLLTAERQVQEKLHRAQARHSSQPSD